jgi:hypothetical protein
MSYRYIKNLRDTKAVKATRLDNIAKTKPTFASKADYRAWCANAATDHVFFNMVEGSTPSKRISNDNLPNKIYGVVADYDAPVNWGSIDTDISAKCSSNMPTWRTKTNSGYLRLIWEFDNALPIAPEMFDAFMKHLNTALKLERLFAGFDSTSLRPSQYFELGEDWTNMGGKISDQTVQTALMKAANEKPPQSSDTSIPIDIIAAEVLARFPNRWIGEFEVGSRGPLFWLDDGIDRDGCQVAEDGMICYSDRAGKGFVTWREIFGGKFVKEYEEKKMGNLLDEYWFNGRSFFKLLFESAVSIPKEQLALELRQMGFSIKLKKGQALSELEAATLTISNQNRIDEIAPVVFSKDRVVKFNGSRILNCANVKPVEPDDDGDPAKWPFIHGWLNQMFVNAKGHRPTIEYLFAWLRRFYKAVLDREFSQGQALLFVGPTGKGKSLLSNRVISQMVGGFADASDYLSGQTKFNKDLGRAAAWVIDDSTSSACFQDQRKATELIKRSVANPRIEYQAKYADAISVPWTGRVIMSTNMDANSLSVIPALDSSNRDKIMALRVRDDAREDFPCNVKTEAAISTELPHFCKWLLDWKAPKELDGNGRFGVASFIDESVASAAYDNSSRSSIAELVEFFARRCRELNSELPVWRGTLTEFQVLLHGFNNGRNVGMSGNLEFVRRGMSTIEDACRSSKHLRPIRSFGRGGGKIWEIDLSEKYDITMTDSP